MFWRRIALSGERRDPDADKEGARYEHACGTQPMWCHQSPNLYALAPWLGIDRPAIAPSAGHA
jgi:hypothetical protein